MIKEKVIKLEDIEKNRRRKEGPNIYVMVFGIRHVCDVVACTERISLDD